MDTSTMIPLDRIRTPELVEYAEHARKFLLSHRWCQSIVSGHLAWAVAGVLGVFLFKLIPARPDVDDTLWVVVGDVPPAYLVCDDSPSWREALDSYIFEMERWVAAARAGKPVGDLIPVNVAPTPKHAAMLQSRLEFIRDKILSAEAGEIESDT